MASLSFLSLPPEVRNLIYVTYLRPHGDVVYVSAARRLIARGPLRKINQQVRSEFESLIDLYARKITFPVYDFEFRYLITFLNKLDKPALASLAAQTTDESSIATKMASPARRLRIQLCFSDGDLLSAKPHLERWLNRFDRPEKNGTAVDFHFEVLGECKQLDQAELVLSRASRRRHVGTVRGDKVAEHVYVMRDAICAAVGEAEAAVQEKQRMVMKSRLPRLSVRFYTKIRYWGGS